MGKILVSEQLSVFKPQVRHPALVDSLRPGFPGLAAGPLPMLFSLPAIFLLSGIYLAYCLQFIQNLTQISGRPFPVSIQNDNPTRTAQRFLSCFSVFFFFPLLSIYHNRNKQCISLTHLFYSLSFPTRS